MILFLLFGCSSGFGAQFNFSPAKLEPFFIVQESPQVFFYFSENCTVVAPCTWTIDFVETVVSVNATTAYSQLTQILNGTGNYTLEATVSQGGESETVSLNVMMLERPKGTVAFSPAETTVGALVALNGTWISGGQLPLFRWSWNALFVGVEASDASFVEGDTMETTWTPLVTNLIGGARTTAAVTLEIFYSLGFADPVSFPIGADVLAINPRGIVSGVTLGRGATTVGATETITVTGIAQGTGPYTVDVVLLEAANLSNVIGSVPTFAAATAGTAATSYSFASGDLIAGAATSIVLRAVVSDSVGIATTAVDSPQVSVSAVPTAAPAFSTVETTATASISLEATVSEGTLPASVVFDVLSDDTLSVVDAAAGTLSFTTRAAGSLPYSFSEGALVAGSATDFSLRAVVTDAVGSSSSVIAPIKITVNPVPSVSEITEERSQAVAAGLPIELCADIAGGTAPFTLAWGARSDRLDPGSSTPLVGSATLCISVVFPDLTDGTNPATLWMDAVATDASGVSSSAGVSSTSLTLYPPVSPVVTVTVAFPPFALVGDAVGIDVAVTGGIPPYTSTSVSALNGSLVVVDTIFNFVGSAGSSSYSFLPATVLIEGDYTLRASAVDSAGNRGHGDSVLTLAPALEGAAIVVPSPTTITANTTLDVVGLTGGIGTVRILTWTIGSPDDVELAPISGATATTYVFTNTLAAPRTVNVSVEVEDEAGHTAVLTSTSILVHPAPTCNATYAVGSGGGSSNATTATAPVSLSAVVSGGLPPYTYSWVFSRDGGIVNYETTFSTDNYTFASIDLGGLLSAVFEVTLITKDSTGVSSPSASAGALVVNAPPAVAVGAVAFSPNRPAVDVECEVTCSVSGGTLPFAYTWTIMEDDGVTPHAELPGNGATGVVTFGLSDLFAGGATDYTAQVQVVDARGVYITPVVGSARVTAMPPITGEVTIAAASATITVPNADLFEVSSISGGMSPYTYQWAVVEADSPFAVVSTLPFSSSTASPQFTTPGTYRAQVVILDSIGTTSYPARSSQTIIVHALPEVAAVTFGASEHTAGIPITITASGVSGGSPPLKYTWTIMSVAGGNTLDTLRTDSLVVSYVFADAHANATYVVGVQVTDAFLVSSPMVTSVELLVNERPRILSVEATVETTVSADLFVRVLGAEGGTGGGYVATFLVTSAPSFGLPGDQLVNATVALTEEDPGTATFEWTVSVDATSGIVVYVTVADALGAKSLIETVPITVNGVPDGEVLVTPEESTTGAAVVLSLPTFTGGTGVVSFRWIVESSAGVEVATAVGDPATLLLTEAMMTEGAPTEQLSIHVEATDALGITGVLLPIPLVVNKPATLEIVSPGNIETNLAMVAVLSVSGGTSPFTVTWTAQIHDLSKPAIVLAQSADGLEGTYTFTSADVVDGVTEFDVAAAVVDGSGIEANVSASLLVVKPGAAVGALVAPPPPPEAGFPVWAIVLIVLVVLGMCACGGAVAAFVVLSKDDSKLSDMPMDAVDTAAYPAGDAPEGSLPGERDAQYAAPQVSPAPVAQGPAPPAADPESPAAQPVPPADQAARAPPALTPAPVDVPVPNAPAPVCAPDAPPPPHSDFQGAISDSGMTVVFDNNNL